MTQTSPIYNSKYYNGTELRQLRPRISAFKTYKTHDGTLIGLFQGNRGVRPDIDFVIKILVPGHDKTDTTDPYFLGGRFIA